MYLRLGFCSREVQLPEGTMPRVIFDHILRSIAYGQYFMGHVMWTRDDQRSGSSLVLRKCLRIDYTFDMEYPFNIKMDLIDSDLDKW